MIAKFRQALSKLRHDAFEIGIVLKGIDAVLEMIGGMMLLSYRTQALNAWVATLTQHELAEDPRDFLATHVFSFFTQLSVDAKTFGGLYLLSHGLVKVVLVWAILKKKMWAYPLLIAFLGAFAAYQGYRFAYSGSALMGLLGAFDVALALLAWREYRAIRLRLS